MPWQRPRGVANGAHRKSGVFYRLTSACPAESFLPRSAYFLLTPLRGKLQAFRWAILDLTLPAANRGLSEPSAAYPAVRILFRVRASPARNSRAAAAGRVFRENAVLNQFKNIAVCRVLGAFCQLLPILRRSVFLQAVQQLIQDQPLPFVQRGCRMVLPESRFAKHCGEGGFCSVKCAIQTIQEPLQPFGYVSVPFCVFSRIS